MSYLVLARKYRPRNFSEMVGQGHVVQALSNALTQQRLHHAYLFTGTRGVGKTTVSRILAKSLNCQGTDGQGGITAEPCGLCRACTDIDSGRFVDYTELDAASNRGVDEISSLLEQAVYKPVQGRFKVFMIDEVHMLSNTAFNAMLKTLEEPPEYLKFVLATTDPQKVPPTVLSRCLQFNLRPMAPETVLEHLSAVLQVESVPAESGALRLLARAARGSMRDALSLTDQAIAFGSGALREDGVRQMLGTVDSGHVFTLIDALAQSDGKTVVDTCDGLRLSGLSAASTLEEMTRVLQRMAVLQAVGGSDAHSPNTGADTDPDAADIARLAVALPADETQLLYSLCLHGLTELGLAPDEYAALTMVLLRLLAFKPQASHGSARAAPSAPAEKKTLTRPEPVPHHAPPEPPERAAADPLSPVFATRAPVAPAAVAAEPITAAQSPTASPTRPASPSPASGGRSSVATGADPENGTAAVAEPFSVRNRPLASAESGGIATEILAIPVRVQPEPSACTEQRTGLSFQPSPHGDFWFEVVQGLVATDAVNAMVRELALQAELQDRRATEWTLRIERESLNQPALCDRLQTALQAAGHEVQLVIVLGPVQDTPARRTQAAQAARQQAAVETIENDPFVQAMLRDFGGRIVPGSIKPLP